MKRKLPILFFVALAVAAPGGAAMIGPDAYGYVAQDSRATFSDISATGASILGYSDDDALEIPIGFSFNFYGTSHTTGCAAVNGVLAFGGCEPTNGEVELTTTATPNDLALMAVLWDDWQTYNPGDGAVYYETVGAPGSRRFIVQWNNVRGWPSSPQPVTFQAVLFEGTNSFQYIYQSVNSGDERAFAGSASVGIRDVGGEGSGRALSWSFHQAWVTDIQAIEFSAAPTAVPEPASVQLAACGLLCGGLAALLRRRRRD